MSHSPHHATSIASEVSIFDVKDATSDHGKSSKVPMGFLPRGSGSGSSEGLIVRRIPLEYFGGGYFDHKARKLRVSPMQLVMDAVTGGLQDKVKAKTKTLNAEAKGAKPTMHESMLYTNLSGCLVAGVLAALAGHLTDGVAFCLKYPEVMNALVIYSLASAVGQNFIYYTITQFNPLILTTVTTTRKIFTTVYSVFRNPANSLALGQWGGCALVFVGLLFEIVEQAVCPKKKKPAAGTPAGGADAEEMQMAPLKSAADDDESLEEEGAQQRSLLR